MVSSNFDFELLFELINNLCNLDNSFDLEFKKSYYNNANLTIKKAGMTQQLIKNFFNEVCKNKPKVQPSFENCTIDNQKNKTYFTATINRNL